MALSPTLVDREQAKFVEDPNGDTAVRVVVTSSLPTPPTILSITPGNLKNTLTWSPVEGATDYVILFSTTSGVTLTDTSIDTASTATTYEHTGLTNGTTYYYRVYAVGAWGNTALGNEDSGTPQAFTNVLSTLLDGLNDFVTFGDNHNYENNVAFTFSAWVKPLNFAPGSNQCLWAKASNDPNVFGRIFQFKTGGQMIIQTRASSQLRTYTTPSAVSAGVWTHICITDAGAQNQSGMRVYFNAAVEATPSSGALTNTLIVSEDSQIGRRNTAIPFGGKVDEVTWWGVALSASEVTELYNSGSPDDPNNHSQAANLQHWYKMGDGSTFPTINDEEGSADGTCTNMVDAATNFVSDVP